MHSSNCKQAAIVSTSSILIKHNETCMSELTRVESSGALHGFPEHTLNTAVWHLHRGLHGANCHWLGPFFPFFCLLAGYLTPSPACIILPPSSRLRKLSFHVNWPQKEEKEKGKKKIPCRKSQLDERERGCRGGGRHEFPALLSLVLQPQMEGLFSSFSSQAKVQLRSLFSTLNVPRVLFVLFPPHLVPISPPLSHLDELLWWSFSFSIYSRKKKKEEFQVKGLAWGPNSNSVPVLGFEPTTFRVLVHSFTHTHTQRTELIQV